MPKDYYDYESSYSRPYISFEGVYKHKYHKGYETYIYDPNIGYLQYDLDGFSSKVIMGNVKMGLQYIFSNRVYLDGYVGVGARVHRYQDNDNTYYIAMRHTL